MAKRIDPDKTHGQKLITLFVKLILSNRSFSLTELARSLNCSKQTVQRLVDQIQSSYSVIIDEEMKGKQKFYSMKKLPKKLPLLGLMQSEYHALQMCQAFSEHLLGRELFEESTRALEKSHSLLSKPRWSSSAYFEAFRPGSIDYTPHQDLIRTLIDAMDKRRICKIIYQAAGRAAPKTFYIKPLKLFSYHETLYLHARKAKTPGKKYKQPEYDPLLAVHRFKSVQITARKYEFPEDYDFEKTFNQNFGVIKGDVFQVEVEFAGFAARYVSERIWSPDQKIIKKRDGKVKLIFSASSKSEFIAWVLSFWDEAKVVKPKWLVEKLKEKINRMQENYA